MSKKNGQMQKNAQGNSSLIVGKKSGTVNQMLVASPRFKNQQQQTLWNMIEDSQPEMTQLIFNHFYENGWQDRGILEAKAHEGYMAFYEDMNALRFKCYGMDAVIAVSSGKKALQDAFKTAKDAIENTYDDVDNGWSILRQFAIQFLEIDPGDLAANFPHVAAAIDQRVQALKALYDGKGDDSLIRTVEPLDIEIVDLLSTITKTGRSAKTRKGTLDWLRKQWREYERQHDGVKPDDVRLAMLDLVATGSPIKSYIPKPDLSDDQKTAFKSLMRRSAMRDVGAYRYDLLER